MIVELLEGKFAEKIGFSSSAMAVSSHNGFGVYEALSTLARMSVLYMAKEQDAPTDTVTSSLSYNSQNAEHMHAQMLQAGKRGSSAGRIKLDKKKHLKPAEPGCCTGPSGKCSC